ncbi:MAG: T9SS type A sorting domain-containing protein [Candidatus Kapabacteria bacterium]|nr:T9SS type A sorting domain-containing protein [Candidatus Kapabacteria bacterium]
MKINFKLLFITLLSFVVFGQNPAYSQDIDTLAPYWGLISGPTAPDVRVLKIDRNNTLYIGTWGGGIFRSFNSGQTWTEINFGLTNLFINAIEFDSSGVIYAGTNGGGLFRSSNNGLSWTAVNNGLTNLYVKAIAFKGNTHIFVGTKGGGVFRSTNSGGNWTESNIGIWFWDITALFVTADGDVVAGTNGGGIYRSSDNALTWRSSNGGINSKNITCFGISQLGEMFCGTLGGGLNFSVNSGVSWSEYKKNNFFRNVTALTFPITADPIVGTDDRGIFRYDSKVMDDWVRTNVRYPGINALARNSQGVLFASIAFEGIFKSLDSGRTWTYVSHKTDSSMRPMLAYKNGLVLASNKNKGIYRSTDNGNTWSQAILPGTTILCFAFDSVGNAYASGVSSSGSILYVSANQGLTWSAMRTFTDTMVTALAVKPDGRLFAALRFPPSDQMNPNAIRTNLITTTDMGGTWQILNVHTRALSGFIAIGVNYNGHIWLISEDTVMRSTNDGVNWTTYLPTAQTPQCIAFNSNNHIFVGTMTSGLYLSTNNGASWTNITFGVQYSGVQFININRRNHIFIGMSYDEGLRFSTNNGSTWDTLISGAIRSSKIESMTLSGDGFLFVATNSLYRYIEPEDLLIPELSSPAYGSGGITLTPTFVWNSVARADMYEFQISKEFSFSNNIESITHSPTQRKINSTLDYNTTYYWRVRSRTNKSLGAWSQPWMFTTIIAPPILVYPQNNTGGHPVTTKLVWKKVDGAGSYTVQVSKDKNFSGTLILNKDFTDTTAEVKGLELYTTYYWRVQARANKNNSEWSETWSFITRLKPPVNRSPANNSYGHPTIVNFEWNPSTGATGYEIQIAKDIDFEQMIFDGETQTISNHQSKLLEYFTEYYWRVRAKDDYGQSDWSTPWKFITVIEAPILTYPYDNEENMKTTVTFQWEPYAKATAYHFQLSEDRNFNSIVKEFTSLDTISVTIPDLAFYKTYFWRVRIKVNNYDGLWASYRTFSTGLAKPELSYPLNNSNNIPLDVTLNWKRVSGAKYYKLYLAKDFNFQNIVRVIDSIETTQFEFSNLDFKTKYYWKVKAFYDKGESEFSDTWQFETVEELSVELADISLRDFSAYPNPFTKIVNINYDLQFDSFVTITIRNDIGIEIEKLFSDYQSQGKHSIKWEPNNINSGVYFIEIKTHKEIFVIKIIHLK